MEIETLKVTKRMCSNWVWSMIECSNRANPANDQRDIDLLFINISKVNATKI